MDIGAVSMAMNQNSVTNSVQLSVMKLALNSEDETQNNLDKMMSSVAVDSNVGTLLDRRA